MGARILVVGSKPKCTVPAGTFDACYAANGAILRPEAQDQDCAPVSVMARDLAILETDIAERLLSKLVSVRCDRIVIVGAKTRMSYSAGFLRRTEGMIVEQFTSWSRMRILFRELGFGSALDVARRRHSTRSLIRRFIFQGEPNALKPSTGLTALLVARERHGEDAEYHVSGVGLAPDGYFDDARFDRRDHVEVDRALITHFAPRENVHFHDVD